MSSTVTTFTNMLGRTITDVRCEAGDDVMHLIASDGAHFRFYHQQGCCENVAIYDVIGDPRDLLGTPMLIAEEVSSEPPSDHEPTPGGSETWTFYRFATVRGSVTVRWLGSSNGYYSESVDYEETFFSSTHPTAAKGAVK